MHELLMPLLVTALAGMSTVLGALLGVAIRRPGARTISLSLGFAAGVMIFVSFAGFLSHSQQTLGAGLAYLFFFVGMVVMFLVDVLVPHDYLAEKYAAKGKKTVFRAGMLAALGIGIHNFPEGMAVFTGMLHDPHGLGWAVAAAIALHNFPEGLAMAAPIYAATGSRKKALGWSLVAALAEPAGAILAAAVLYPLLSPTVMAATLAAVAGIMIFISLDELLPAAREEGGEHLSIVGVTAGMAVMAAGLWLLDVAAPGGHGHGHGARQKQTAPEHPAEGEAHDRDKH